MANPIDGIKARWRRFLDTSADGSVVWVVRRGCEFLAAFAKALGSTLSRHLTDDEEGKGGR